MIRKILFCTLLVSLSYSSYASCRLPHGQRLTVGCSNHCDFLYRLRLKLSGLAMGYPVKVVNLRSFPEMREGMRAVDAILIPGGADIHPNFYLDRVTTELASYTRANMNLVKISKEGAYRDAYEYSLVSTYGDDPEFLNLPMLGICRGMQMMTVAQGIPLYLDIKTELGIKNRKNLFDRIHVEDQDSLMSSLYGRRKFRGFEQHHQGLRLPYYLEHAAEYPLSRVTATSNNGKIAEAIEYQHRPALGVQYHPEKSLTSTTFPVFKWFLTKACEYKTSKDGL